jgi:hypothetical protein
MSVIIVLATIECDCCGTRFKVEVDPGSTRPKDWSFYELVVDAVRGGDVHEGESHCSVEGDKLRCGKCTSEEDAAFIAAHPDYICGIHAGHGGVWIIETYDGTKYHQQGGVKPAFDTPISAYPEAKPAGTPCVYVGPHVAAAVAAQVTREETQDGQGPVDHPQAANLTPGMNP